MSENHDDNYRRPRHRSFLRDFLTEEIVKLLFKAGAFFVVAAIVVGSVASHYDISITAAISGIFTFIVLAVLAYAVLTNME